MLIVAVLVCVVAVLIAGAVLALAVEISGWKGAVVVSAMYVLLAYGIGHSATQAAVHGDGHYLRVAKPTLTDLLACVPAPPRVQFVPGRAPDLPLDSMAPAASNGAQGIIWSERPLDKMGRGHEVGHLLDAQVLTDGDRSWFQRHFFKESPGAWNQGTGSKGLLSPNELFADWYGNAVAGNDPAKGWESSYDAIPDAKQFRQFVAALDRLGKRNGLKPYR